MFSTISRIVTIGNVRVGWSSRRGIKAFLQDRLGDILARRAGGCQLDGTYGLQSRSHGLEIRGWKVPIVQGTQEKRRNTARTNLNVASTVGFFQPRISNPWLLSYLAFAVMCPGNFLPRSRAAADYRDPFAGCGGEIYRCGEKPDAWVSGRAASLFGSDADQLSGRRRLRFHCVERNAGCSHPSRAECGSGCGSTAGDQNQPRTAFSAHCPGRGYGSLVGTFRGSTRCAAEKWPARNGIGIV